MKKLVAIISLAIMVLGLAACGGGKFTCDICGNESSGKKYSETLFGEKITYCKDCKAGFDALGDLEF